MARGPAIEQLSAALSRRRGKRWLHPFGDGYHAVLEIAGGAGSGAPLFDAAATHAAIARHSRALGTPKPLPDAYGLAFRLPDLHGRGRHQDFLVTTSIDAPVLHHLPLPAPGGPWTQSYSSALAYRIGTDVRLVGAIPVPSERAFDIALAPLLGRWQVVGRLRLGERLPERDTEALQFNPWNTGGGIVPTGPFQRVRRPVYRGSQRGRP